MKKAAILLVGLLTVLRGAGPSFGQQAVSEEARRHFDRGMAAVEMAAEAGDYGSAVKEFAEAARLAPDWPDAHYNLGMVQEKAGKFAEAAQSLRTYLRLSPGADDAEAVKSLINKLEYRAENILTVPAIIDVLFEYGASSKWRMTGKDDMTPFIGFQRAGTDSITYISKDLHYQAPYRIYRTTKVEGPILNLSITIDQCHPVTPGSCPRVVEAEIEVVSKTHVRVKGVLYWLNRDNSRRHPFACEYRKIV